MAAADGVGVVIVSVRCLAVPETWLPRAKMLTTHSAPVPCSFHPFTAFPNASRSGRKPAMIVRANHMNDTEMFELAQSSEQSPPPAYGAIYAGFVGAMVMSFMGFAGSADRRPIALGVIVALGFLIPLGFLKLQDRLHRKRRRPPANCSENVSSRTYLEGRIGQRFP